MHSTRGADAVRRRPPAPRPVFYSIRPMDNHAAERLRRMESQRTIQGDATRFTRKKFQTQEHLNGSRCSQGRPQDISMTRKIFLSSAAKIFLSQEHTAPSDRAFSETPLPPLIGGTPFRRTGPAMRLPMAQERGTGSAPQRGQNACRKRFDYSCSGKPLPAKA